MNLRLKRLKNELSNKTKSQCLFFIALRFSRFDGGNIFKRIIGKFLNLFVLQLTYNCDIPSKVKFGKNLRVPHPYNIIINENCTIGDNVTIFHEVTIGNDKHNGLKTIISDNVYIGCGAKIIGVNRIGNNSKIGAGSVVLKDVEDDTTVVGIYK